ncbi:hypothetical protein VHE8714_03668 [Vibrio splendidus]|nr:hypothetical protein VHE8714_03668 [Vibrio splendidus]
MHQKQPIIICNIELEKLPTYQRFIGSFDTLTKNSAKIN